MRTRTTYEGIQKSRHRAVGLRTFCRLLARDTRRVTALAVILLLASTSFVAISDSAQAATPGPGFAYNATSRIMLFKQQDGSLTACMDPGVSAPFGTTTDAGIVTSYLSHGKGGTFPTTVSAGTLGKINHLMTRYATNPAAVSDVMGAALALTVARRSNPTAWNAETAPWGVAYYRNYMTASQYTQFQSLVNQYTAEFDGFTPTGGVGSGHITNTVDNNNYTGTVTLDRLSPSPQQGQLTLTNGVFADGSTVKTGTFTEGQSFAVTGVPPAGATHYEISESYTGQVPGGPANNVHLWTTPGQQGVAGVGGVTSGTFTMTNHDPFDRSTYFAPVVTTQATTAFVKAGQFPADTLTFGTTNFTDPVSGQSADNPWPQTSGGKYAPVMARGIWYGPFASPITPANVAPSNSLIAGHSTVTTTTAQGPTGSYQAVSDTAAVESGYYSWVQSITAGDSPASTQKLMPPAYSFTDQFGRVQEGQVSPSIVSFVTQVSAPSAQIGESVTDTITPTLSGGSWLQDGGARIPVTLTGTTYWSADRPVQAATPPTGSTPVGTATMVLTGPSAMVSPSIPVGYRPGFVTIQWALISANQPKKYQGYFAEYSDNYGVPAETVQVFGPTIVTTAAATTPHGVVHDSATVSGHIPPQGVDLNWSGYRRPLTSTTAVCSPATLLYSSTAPVVAMAAGQYQSEDFDVPGDLVGSIDWVIHATLHGTTTPISDGTCGEVGETSTSASPLVVTTPPTGLFAGATAIDHARLTGIVPANTELNFLVYRQDPTVKTLECTPANSVPQKGMTTALTPGVYDASHPAIASPPTAPLAAGNYGFVVQLRNITTGEVYQTGACLDEPFTVAVIVPPIVIPPVIPPAVVPPVVVPVVVPSAPAVLAFTGVSSSLLLLFGGIGGGSLIAGVALVAVTRRRRAQATAQ